MDFQESILTFKGWEDKFDEFPDKAIPYALNTKELKDSGLSKDIKIKIIKQYAKKHNSAYRQKVVSANIASKKYTKTNRGYRSVKNSILVDKKIAKAIQEDWTNSNYAIINEWIDEGYHPIFLTHTLKPEHNHDFYDNVIGTISNQKKLFNDRLKKYRKSFNLKEIYTYELTKKFNVHFHGLMFVKEDEFDSFVKSVHKLVKDKRNKVIGETDIQFFNQEDQDKAKMILGGSENLIWTGGNSNAWVVKDVDKQIRITKHNSFGDDDEKITAYRMARYIFKYLDKDEIAPLFLKKEIHNPTFTNELRANGMTKPVIDKFFKFMLIKKQGTKHTFINLKDTKFKHQYLLRFQELINDETKHLGHKLLFIENANYLDDLMYERTISDEKLELFCGDDSLLANVLPYTNGTPVANNWHIILRVMPFEFKENDLFVSFKIGGYEVKYQKGKVESDLTESQVLARTFDLTEMEADLFSKNDDKYKKHLEIQNTNLHRLFLEDKNFEVKDSHTDLEHKVKHKIIDLDDIHSMAYKKHLFNRDDFLLDNPLNIDSAFSGEINDNYYELLNKAWRLWDENHSIVFITKNNADVDKLNSEFEKRVKQYYGKNDRFSMPVVFSESFQEQGIIKSKIYKKTTFKEGEVEPKNRKVVLEDDDGNYFYVDAYILETDKCRPAFAITIDNSQGRSLNNVCFYQVNPDYLTYSHFYTAISRTKNKFFYLMTEEVYSRILITAKGNNMSFAKEFDSFFYVRNSFNSDGFSSKDYNTITRRTGLFSLNYRDALGMGVHFEGTYNSAFVSVLNKMNDKVMSLNPEPIALMENHNKENHNLSDEQIEACNVILSNSMSVIRGDGGTGKTRMIKHLIEHLVEQGTAKEDIKVCAFTNAQIDVLREHVEEKHLSTIHRLLGLSIDGKPSHQIEGDIVIVDEASMVSLDLFYWLIMSLKDHQRIVFLGDHKQLHPVATFSMFSYLRPDFTLKHNFRVAEARGNSIKDNVALAIQKVISYKQDGIDFSEVGSDFYKAFSYYSGVLSNAQMDKIA